MKRLGHRQYEAWTQYQDLCKVIRQLEKQKQQARGAVLQAIGKFTEVSTPDGTIIRKMEATVPEHVVTEHIRTTLKELNQEA